MKPKAPCLKCEERHPNCHSTCEKYVSYRKDLDKYNLLKQKEKAINRGIKSDKYY